MPASKSEATLPKSEETSRVAFLHEVSLFQDIRELPGALETLSKVMKEKTYKPHVAIIQEGESGSEMYFLMDGTASVYKCTTEGEPYKVAIIQGTQRAFFGEGGLLDLESRSATIKTDTECRCLVLNGSEFAEFGRAYPQWALPVLNRIARAVMVRLRKTNNDLMLLYNALVAEIRGK